MIDRLKRYISIRSVTRDEGALADAVTCDLTAAGLSVQRSDHNLWCVFGDQPRPRLLLNSHLDTVPAGDGWDTDPWTPTERDGAIHGLGANDAKGCVTAMLTAALVLKRELDAGKPLGGTVVLALTAEEEISGRGLGTIRPQLLPLDAALVGEPTNLVPMIAQRGLLILKLTTHGRTAHPANTPRGTADNAILKALHAIERLDTFDWGPHHPLLGDCWAHVTQINGGVARNVIPDRCEFWLDVRTTPAETHAELVHRLRSFVDAEVHVHSDRLVPVQTAGDAAIVQAVRAALPDAAPAGSPAMSDMVFLPGVPTVKIGPGISARSHTPNEFITGAELAAGAAAYERIVRAYFACTPQPQACGKAATGGAP